jgi:hypothetical protein
MKRHRHLPDAVGEYCGLVDAGHAGTDVENGIPR